MHDTCGEEHFLRGWEYRPFTVSSRRFSCRRGSCTSNSSPHPLHEPEQSDRGDDDGAGDDDALAVPGFLAKRDSDQHKRDHDDGELTKLDAGVEEEERRQELR